jgi:hypothetical protein
VVPPGKARADRNVVNAKLEIWTELDAVLEELRGTEFRQDHPSRSNARRRSKLHNLWAKHLFFVICADQRILNFILYTDDCTSGLYT